MLKRRRLNIESCEPRRLLAADCNLDGLISRDDLACVSQEVELDFLLAQTELVKGDLDGDGEVGFGDFLVLSTNFGATNAGYVRGDLDLSGAVEFSDFLILSTNFGKEFNGSQSIPWAFVLCKSPGTPPPAWDANVFEGLVGADTPDKVGTINHYWREVSYNNINLDDARVATEWAATENDFDSYIGERWMQACIDAAEADMDFTDVTHVMFVLQPTSVRAGGGALRWLNLEGETRRVQIQHMYWEAWGHTTAWWAGPSRLPMLGTPLHEMGHSLGFPHIKIEGSRIDYSNPWDVMSNSSLTPTPFQESNIRMPQGTTVVMRDQAGWIEEAQKRKINTATFSGTEHLVLATASEAQPANQIQMLELVHEGKSYFFEARTRVGYDSQLELDSVLLYARDPLTNRIQLLDGDLDDDAFDADATWLPGDTFEIGGLQLRILRQTDAGFEIRLTVPIALP